jgi:hypothetical protein
MRSLIRKQFLQFITLALLTAGLIVSPVAQVTPMLFGGGLSTPPVVGTQSAIAQTVRINQVWQRIYDLMPELPLENQYVSTSTGQVASTNTLANRLIRYHTFIKGRASNYRFDWKLTLADYLGANERIIPGTYPGADSLNTSPLPGDRAAISNLTRAQRDQLVNILVSLFSTAADAETPVPSVSPSPSTSPTPRPSVSPTPAGPVEARPGDARLLLP